MALVLGILDGSKESRESMQEQKKFLLRNIEDEITYIVFITCDEDLDDAKLAPGIPRIYEVVNFGDSLVKCVDVQAREVTTCIIGGEQGVIAHVRCSFNNKIDDQRQESPDPVDMVPEVSWGSEREKEVLRKDPVTGAAIETQAHEPIFIEDDITLAVCEIERYEPYPFDESVILDYVNHVNDKPFKGAPKGCVLMDAIRTKEQVVNNTRLTRVIYILKFKIKKDESGNKIEDTWMIEVPHQGYKYKHLITDEERVLYEAAGLTDLGNPAFDIRIATDPNGQPMIVRLRNEEDLAEIGLAGGGGLKLGNEEEMQYLKFHRKHYADFDALQLLVKLPS